MSKKEAKAEPEKRCHPEPLTEIPDCPKCGRDEPSVIYEERYPTTSSFLSMGPGRDYLRLKCRRCGYVWRVRPFDVDYEREAAGDAVYMKALAGSHSSRSWFSNRHTPYVTSHWTY